MSPAPSIELLRGAAIQPWIHALAQLRIAVFREWPYLYAGDADYEAQYLQTYVRSAGALLVLARDGETVVGCSTALPLSDETPEVQAPFVAAGIALHSVCYFGESVLLRQWRGQGLGHRFFDAREAHARGLAGVTHSAFCAVDRDPRDPRRPAEVRSLEAFWTARGYQRQPQLVASLHWLELGASTPSPHPLTFWTRAL